MASNAIGRFVTRYIQPKKDTRPRQYPVGSFTGEHVALLQQRFSEIINLLVPHFAAAEQKAEANADSKTSRSHRRRIEGNEKYTSPLELKTYLRLLSNSLGDLAARIKNHDTTELKGADLSVLRCTRAICCMVSSHGKKKAVFGGEFGSTHLGHEFRPPLRDKIETKKNGSVSISNGGILNLCNIILKGEEIFWGTDLAYKRLKVSPSLYQVMREYAYSEKEKTVPSGTTPGSKPQLPLGRILETVPCDPAAKYRRKSEVEKTQRTKLEAILRSAGRPKPEEAPSR